MQAIVHCNGKVKNIKELQYTPSGTAVLSWSFAQKSGFGENVQFDWYQASLYGAQAESLARKIVEGTRFSITGRQKLNVYQKKDGTTGVTIKVDILHFEFDGEAPKKQESQEEDMEF